MSFLLTVFCFGNMVYATNSGGGANNDDWVAHGCGEAKTRQNVRQCPTDDGNWGGASWHIFKTTNTPSLDQSGDPPQGRPVARTSIIGAGYPDSRGTVSEVCPSSQYEYYFAYVYDGWWGVGNWSGNKPLIYWGPLDWGTYRQVSDGVVHIPVYHKGNDHTWAEIEAGLANGTDMNGWRMKGEAPASWRSGASYESAEMLYAWRVWSGDANAQKIPDRTGFFCAGPSTVTLKAWARALPKKSDGTYDLLISGPIDSVTVKKGENAPVDSNKFDKTGWTWMRWGNQGKCAGQERKCTVNNLTVNDDVYSYYEKNEWQAQSIASKTSGGSAIATAGYSSTTPSPTPSVGFIDNCDPVNGCQVYFRHNIKRVSGGGTTSYVVSRTSNLTKSSDSAKGIDNNDSVATGSSNANGSEKQASSSGPFTLYPGMIVCERITFKGFNVPDSTDQHTEVCVMALGKSQPDDPPSDTPEDPNSPSGDTSFINIKVRNNKVTAYNKYQRLVYAKPTDEIKYRVVYNPKLQYTYRIKAKKNRMKVSIDGGTAYDGDNKTIGTLFNDHKNPDWNNDYAISSNFAASNRNYEHSVNNTNGDVSTKTEEIPGSGNSYYIVKGSDVGRTLEETATVNNSDVTLQRNGSSNDNRTTPVQVEFKPEEGSSRVAIGDVKTTPAPSKKATALVPYNFRNETKINNTNKVVYAGETLTVEHDYIINPKTNSYTSPNNPYITNIGDPQWKIGIRVVGGGSYWTSIHKPGNDDDNFTVSDSKMSQTKTIPTTTNINIPDVSAGTTICIRSAVYPKDSYSDSNLNKNAYDINNANSWAYSPEVCFTVAKKPSIQVWGGNIYTRGKVTTATSTKNNIAGYNNYSYKVEGNSNGVRAFGSFGELGLIASGKVTELSSGASLGFASNNNNGVLSPSPYGNATTTPDPGGSKKSSICDRSPLTFANYPCSDAVGQLGKTATTTNMDDDKNNVLGKFIKELEGSNTGSPVVLNDRSKAQSDNTYYYYSTEDLDVGNSASDTGITKSTIQVVHSKKTLFVRGNLTYNETYQKYSELPKLVLYGKNVVIDCNVTRIDALILADEKVVTCNNYSKDINTTNDADFKDDIKNHINEAANSNPLKINGAIVAKTLISNRTYGAASGANSIVPAEIINFDPTLYMWGGFGNDEGSDGDLEVTLTRELAPRR